MLRLAQIAVDLEISLLGKPLHETIENESGCARNSRCLSLDLVTPCGSQVNRDFWTTYAHSPEQAIGDFYQLSQKNDYIKLRLFLRISYRVPSDYRRSALTSKPEKDPKEIAA